MERTHPPVAAVGTPWQARLAGGLLVGVGAVNAGVGVWALVGGGAGLGVGAAGGLLVAGVVTVAAGVLVWRGSRPVTLVALTVFALLLVVQAGDLADASDVGDDLVPLVLLLALVGALGLAAWRGRRPARRASRPPDAGSGTG